jgi:hypothetical protein
MPISVPAAWRRRDKNVAAASSAEQLNLLKTIENR